MLGFFLNSAQPVFLAKGGDQVRQALIGNPCLQLTIQCIGGRLAQRVAVNVVNRFEKFLGLKQSPFDLFGKSL